MTDEPDSLVLQHLRTIRTELAALREDVKDIKRRMTSLETAVGSMAATELSHYANGALRADRTDDRLDRIERRLDLTEAG
jgi:phage shock protein A